MIRLIIDKAKEDRRWKHKKLAGIHSVANFLISLTSSYPNINKCHCTKLNHRQINQTTLQFPPLRLITRTKLSAPKTWPTTVTSTPISPGRYHFSSKTRIDRHDELIVRCIYTQARTRAMARIRMMKRCAAGAIWLTTFWKRADRSWACVETLRCRTGFAWARGALHLARYAAYDGRDRWLCVWKPACELARPVLWCGCSSRAARASVWVRCTRPCRRGMCGFPVPFRASNNLVISDFSTGVVTLAECPEKPIRGSVSACSGLADLLSGDTWVDKCFWMPGEVLWIRVWLNRWNTNGR